MSEEKTPARGPDSIVVDLAECVHAYEKTVKPLARHLRRPDAGYMVEHISQNLYARDTCQDELAEITLSIRNNIEEQGNEKAALCFSTAADRLGEALIEKFGQHGMYAPDGSLEYYFAGFLGAEGNAAVFRNLVNERERERLRPSMILVMEELEIDLENPDD